MIPRFIVLNIPEHLLKSLTDLGYKAGQEPLSKDVLVLGQSILNSTTVPEAKNPLIKVYDLKSVTFKADREKAEKDILKHAALQLLWTGKTVKKELLLGAEKKGKVIISPVGVMIDSCVIPIEVFIQTRRDLEMLVKPLLASHIGHINPSRPFITVGCDDYCLEDLSTIISTYSTLLEPAS